MTCSNYRTLYWTVPQMIAHHTAGGCNLQPGDMVATGTLSMEVGMHACGCGSMGSVGGWHACLWLWVNGFGKGGEGGRGGEGVGGTPPARSLMSNQFMLSVALRTRS